MYRITNYFPKKEKLLLGIVDHYEKKLEKLSGSKSLDSRNLSFQEMVKFYSEIMDLNYEYRFAISFLTINPLSDDELLHHIRYTFQSKKKRLFQRVSYLVETGSLDKKILTNDVFEVFCFQFMTLFTSWINNLELYDKAIGYQRVKPIYLKGIMHSYVPYLTEQGQEEMNSALAGL
jgi:hypothetical protein